VCGVCVCGVCGGVWGSVVWGVVCMVVVCVVLSFCNGKCVIITVALYSNCPHGEQMVWEW